MPHLLTAHALRDGMQATQQRRQHASTQGPGSVSVGGQQDLHECITLLLIKDNTVLAEQRKLTKQVVPGAIALPGGHMEENESPEDALYRKLHEELGITPSDMTYVCTLLHCSQEFCKLHYFAVHNWEGEITNHEAEALLWVPFDDQDTLILSLIGEQNPSVKPCNQATR